MQDLLVDTGNMTVRYLELKLSGRVAKEVNASAERLVDDRSALSAHRAHAAHAADSPTAESHHNDDVRFALVPIATARFDEKSKKVLLQNTAAHVAGIDAHVRRPSTAKPGDDRGDFGESASVADRAGSTARDLMESPTDLDAAMKDLIDPR